MTDRKTLVARALVEKQILKDLTEAHYRTRTELAALFVDAGDREVGKLYDHRLGTVALEKGRESWIITDEQAFTEWAAENWPNEVETVKKVRASLRSWVLETCRQAGGVPDPVTGEVEEVPGVIRQKGAPTLVERTDKQASFVIREALGDVYERLEIEPS